MKPLRLLLLAALPLVAFAATSDPVGALRLKLRGGSDTIVSLPLHRPTLVEGTLSARSGNQLTLDASIPALPVEGAFVLVMSGALEGAVLPVASKSGNTLTVEETRYDSSLLEAGSAGALVAVIPYWTLDTLFPSGRGVHVSSSALNRATDVMFFNDTIAGKDFSVAATYFYFSGNSGHPAGWYRVGTTTSSGTVRIPPHQFFIIRHNSPDETSLLVTGGVQMASYSIPLHIRAANTDQDNFVALPIATPTSLAQSGLLESGAFEVSASAINRADQLMVFNNAASGQNKSVSATYFYFAGNTTYPAGWYKAGTTQNADGLLLSPGDGFIIRKKQQTSSGARFWRGTPTYLQ